MKTKKTSLTIAMIFALLAVTITACHSPNSPEEGDTRTETITVTESTELPVSSFKFEVGQVIMNDYLPFQNWFLENDVHDSAEMKTQRDSLYAKTIEGTYQDKGNLSSTEIKAFLSHNGCEDLTANSIIVYANECGNRVAGLFFDPSYQKVMWVYLEKVSENLK